MKTTQFRITKIILTLGLLAMPLSACDNSQGQPPAGAASHNNSSSSDGAQLFDHWHCGDCHRHDGKGPAPSLVGIAATSIILSNGESVLVDEDYVRTSILEPNAQIHEGYQPIMPALAEQIGVDGVSILVEYILSLE